MVRGSRSRVTRIEAGNQAIDGAARIAIYAHFSPYGEVHEMIRRQIGEYRAAGYAIVFVTMAAHLAESDRELLQGIAGLIVERRSFGRDFGAWKDVFGLVCARAPQAQEILLANDSVLGPIRPIAPLLGRLRQQGAGLCGLTESKQGPPHVQSYLALLNGERAIADTGRFLARLRLSRSRWLMVRRGEYALTRFLRRRGHRVSSLFPYDDVVRALRATAPSTSRVAINPTHHGWRVLVEQFGFPFLKMDAVLRNPNRVPDIRSWPEVVSADAPVPVPVIADYISQIQRAPSLAPRPAEHACWRRRSPQPSTRVSRGQ
jgi:hypothetical protein